ncbi:MAG: PilT/PilU family type 4a pilus ATPase [bacterium]|nr:PilT/PilU family type 4a pilus ATPase [bacterium]
MAELILGVGQHRTAREIVAASEDELRKIEGLARKLVVRTSVAEIVAERDAFDVPFQTYTVRLKKERFPEDKLAEFAAKHADTFTVSEEEGWRVITFKGVKSAPPKREIEDEPLPADGIAELDADEASETVDAAAGDGAQEEAPPDPDPEPLSPASGNGVGAICDKLTEVFPLPEVWRIHGEGYRADHISTEFLFKAMIQYKASDVHLSPGQPPVFRVDNETHTSELLGPLSAAQIRAVIREIATDRDWATFKENFQASFNYHQMGLGYSRVSCFTKAGAPHCTFRFLPEVIPSFDALSIPSDTMIPLAKQHHGLILVTGMTGSGKSTTMAALVDWINSNKACHILTIENPVEYVHRNKKAIVSQRSTGTDCTDFFQAVTGALRHDPDVIVIGEMRDPDTIRSAISAAATGHLVISTLHANTASEVVNRVVSFFDPVERDLVKLQLRDCLRCVICQRLVPKMGGGRLPALEMMINDIKPINDGIVAGDTDMIRIGMQQTVSHSFLFEHYLLDMYKDKKVDLDLARYYATEPSVLDQMVMGTYSIPRLDSIKGIGH